MLTELEINLLNDRFGKQLKDTQAIILDDDEGKEEDCKRLILLMLRVFDMIELTHLSNHIYRIFEEI